MQAENKSSEVIENNSEAITKVDENESASKTSSNMPYIIEYCPHCTFPPEYCQYSNVYAKCKLFLQEKYPQYLKDETQPQEPSQEKVNEENKEESKKEETVTEEQPKKKVAIKEEKKIEISVKKRNNKKFLTLILGLEHFDIKVKDAAKKMGKRFACGSSVVENNGIEIQGDVADDLIPFIVKEFNISEDKIILKEKKN